MHNLQQMNVFKIHAQSGNHFISTMTVRIALYLLFIIPSFSLGKDVGPSAPSDLTDDISLTTRRLDPHKIGPKDHVKGWFGIINCAGEKRKGCNTFYGPYEKSEAQNYARILSGDKKPIFHDRHGEYPHYHLAGHSCVQMTIDCWKDGKKKPEVLWTNPHFWIHGEIQQRG